jgi:hypothetical protein
MIEAELEAAYPLYRKIVDVIVEENADQVFFALVQAFTFHLSRLSDESRKHAIEILQQNIPNMLDAANSTAQQMQLKAIYDDRLAGSSDDVINVIMNMLSGMRGASPTEVIMVCLGAIGRALNSIRAAESRQMVAESMWNLAGQFAKDFTGAPGEHLQ